MKFAQKTVNDIDFPQISRMIRLAIAGLAAVAGVAHADSSQVADGSSSVQMYGLIGLYFDSQKLSTMSTRAQQVGGGGLTTSYWGVRGREDLGGGTAAIFALEGFINPATGQAGRNSTDGPFARNTYVGFSSAYGTIKFGEQTNPTYLNQQLVNPLGSSVVFAPLIVQSYTASYNNTQIGDSVWHNAIEYTSPSYGGVTGTVIYGLNSSAGGGQKS